ncbi:hypothetical protein V6Z11_D02G024300 [Gossypium hirsutum]
MTKVTVNLIATKGCCIRHRYDYGAIILLDEKNRAHISKWLRLSIRMYGSFEKSLDELRSFFREVKDLVLVAVVMTTEFNSSTQPILTGNIE